MKVNVDNKIYALLNQYGGRHNNFVQTEYIKNNQWSNINPTKRKGAWTSNTYSEFLKMEVYGLREGVCAGLVSAYLVSGRSWESFTRYIKTESGKSMIRGIHNFQNQLRHVINNRLYKGGVTWIDISKTVIKDKGVVYSKGGNIPIANFRRSLSKDVLSNLDIRTGYLFCITFGQSAHAIGLRISLGTIRFFDPNYGEFILPYHNGNGENMSFFIESFLKITYPKIDSCEVHCFTVI